MSSLLHDARGPTPRPSTPQLPWMGPPSTADHRPTEEPHLDPGVHRWRGTHSIDGVYGDGHGRAASWFVEVYPTGTGVGVERRVQVWARDAHATGQWCEWEPLNRWRPERVIWPSWTVGPTEDGSGVEMSALDSAHESWRDSSDRIRDAAKWMATVIGVALAAVVGTSPLAVFSRPSSGPMGWALVLAVVGLLLLAATMVLVLRVLSPGNTSYLDVQLASHLDDVEAPSRARRWWRPANLWGNPLTAWSETVESQQDLWLPSGVKCLTTLRQAMIVDELTLMALSCAVTDSGVRDDDIATLQSAQAVRVARLREFRQAAARIVEIGEFHRLRQRNDWATYVGGAMSAMATILIICAFVVLR